MKLTGTVALTVAAVVLSLMMLRAVDAQPQVTFLFPAEGDFFSEPPSRIQMCFANPVNIRGASEDGLFRFQITTPEGRSVGHRVSFQLNGLGVAIFPNIPNDPQEGEWTFEWRVADADRLEIASGTLTFSTGPGGKRLPDVVPDLCTESGAPISRHAPPAAGQGDDGVDILLAAVITTASFLGAAALGLILYVVRRRIGFCLHRPPPEEGAASGDDH